MRSAAFRTIWIDPDKEKQGIRGQGKSEATGKLAQDAPLRREKMPRKAALSHFLLNQRKSSNYAPSTDSANIQVSSQDAIFSGPEWSEIVNDLGISQRQAEVLRELLQGRSDKQIAQSLGLSVGTVRTHLDRLFLRFRTQDRCELIVLVFRHFRRKCRFAGCPRLEQQESV